MIKLLLQFILLPVLLLAVLLLAPFVMLWCATAYTSLVVLGNLYDAVKQVK